MLDRRQFISIRQTREVSGIVGTTFIFVVNLAEIFFQFFARHPHGFGIPEEIFSAKEEAFARALRPREAKILSEFSDRRKRLISLDAFTPNRNGFHGTGKRFHHRGFAGAVLAYKERDWRSELNLTQRFDNFQVKWKYIFIL